MNEELLRHILVDAQAAFWEKVAQYFPEIKTGDLDVYAEIDFDEACKRVIIQWHELNKGA